jgi:hypothetical protein
MSTGAVVGIVVAVIVVVAAAVALAMSRRGAGSTGTAGLKRRFGPEYDRTLARHDGDAKAANKELAGRVKRYGSLDRLTLPPAERERYEALWQDVQTHFVTDPGRAVDEADRLIADLAAARGYPSADSPEHLDALSVHHAHRLHGYRQAHALAEHTAAGGRHDTEDLRQALVGARELFEELLGDTTPSDTRSAARRPTADAPAAPAAPAAGAPAGNRADERAQARGEAMTDPAARPVGEQPTDPADERTTARPVHDEARDEARDEQEPSEQPAHRSLGDRFAALTGVGRDHSGDGGHGDDSRRA